MSEIEKLDLNDPETKSADVVAGNVEALKALFPEAFTEGRIDIEVLKGLLGAAVDERDEKYGLNWHGKRRARQIALTPSTGTLLPCPDESVDWDTTQNLMIEGDNLEVLKLLQKSYAGKVKLIYIDPPYNTGTDFVYRDDFTDSMQNYLAVTGQTEGGRKTTSNTESSGRFHTEWLNMVYPRLKLARNLLKQDGAIFISIDDGEQGNLRLLCDDVFGQKNFIANVIWQKKFARQNDAAYFSTMHDFIICYAKNSRRFDPDGWSLDLLPRDDADNTGYSNPDDDKRGPWTSVVLSAKSGTEKLRYPIVTPSGRTCLPPDGRYWGVSADKLKILIAENRIWFGKEGNGIPRLKTFLSEVQNGLRPNTLWLHDEVSHNQEARQSLNKLFDGKAIFDSPKPVKLLQRIIQIAAKEKDSVVMDFFAGSGTMAHAVMSQNAEDTGQRRYIAIQLPEPLSIDNEEQKPAATFCKEIGKPATIAEITKERIRRAAKALRDGSPMFSGDTGFRVFKLAASNIRAWEPDAADLESSLLKTAEHLVQGRKEQDVLYELLLKLGLDLCVPIEAKTIAGKSVHSIGGGALIVCLADGLTKDVIEPLAAGIVAWRAALAPAVDTRVVFKDSGFADDIAKTNMAAILNQNGITDVRSL